jgi:hypothetical protein
MNVFKTNIISSTLQILCLLFTESQGQARYAHFQTHLNYISVLVSGSHFAFNKFVQLAQYEAAKLGLATLYNGIRKIYCTQ